jgi:tetratricopeptide (TPR) repeat protein
MVNAGFSGKKLQLQNCSEENMFFKMSRLLCWVIVYAAVIIINSHFLAQQVASAIVGPYTNSFAYENAPPIYYSQRDLAEKLAKLLTGEEQRLVINPLVYTPQMASWARQLTAQATNDDEKARLLFIAFLHRQQKTGPPATDVPRTAPDVFAEWDNPQVAFSCRDNALLYEALARSVGLTALDVYVQESANGSLVPHDCAIVNFGHTGILVDPSYHYYGIRHRKFTIMNDLQVIALYMSEFPDLVSSQIAVKLAPELSLVQENYFEKLSNIGRVAEARRILPAVERLNTNATVIAYVEGSLALAEGRTGFAISSLGKAIAGNPLEGTYYYHLAKAYAEDSRFPDAREALKAALHCQLMASEASWMEQLIANTNALAVWGLTSRGWAMTIQGDLPEAIKSYQQAVRIDPNSNDSFFILGFLHFDCHEYQDALINLRRASEAAPSNPYPRFYIWLARLRLGDKTAATEELRKFLDGRQPESHDDWTSKIGRFLIGQMSDAELFQAADKLSLDQGGEYHCEAFFYAGEKQLISGDKITAENDFKKCIATDDDGEVEYFSAKAELQTLDK